MGFGALLEHAQGLRPQPVQRQHLGARQHGADELEGGVFGGGADERDGAVFHVGQEAVLLGPVEAVDLVDEQAGAPALLAPGARRLEGLLEVGDAGKDRRHLLEIEPGMAGEQPGDRGLAGAGRAPQHDRGDAAGLDHAGQHAFRPHQMVLADDVAKLCGRSRSASGRGASSAMPAASNRLAMTALACDLHAHEPAAALDRDLPDAAAAPRDASAPGDRLDLSTATPLTSTSTSPLRKPTRRAGPPRTSSTTTPEADEPASPVRRPPPATDWRRRGRQTGCGPAPASRRAAGSSGGAISSTSRCWARRP
jgi:hypothetical protein